MNTVVVLLLLAAALAALISYTRHDRFAGPSSTHHLVDDLGETADRHHLVPRT